VYLDDYYMLHIWVVDDLEYHGDIHAPMHPCITSSGAIFDMDDPCHGTGGMSAAAEVGSAAAASAASGGDDPSTALFCPIGRLEDPVSCGPAGSADPAGPASVGGDQLGVDAGLAFVDHQVGHPAGLGEVGRAQP